MLVIERAGTARDLVRLPPDPLERTAVVARPSDGAVVLGSAQPTADVDVTAAAAAGLSVLRRRSGGGAVVVAPDAQLWVDLFVPSGDPLFDRDVTRAAVPVGEAWRAALVASGLGADELAVHRGGLVAAPHSRELCFLGLGPGEVSWRGRKVVGLSQRRTRAGAWFFTMGLLAAVDPVAVAVLATDPATRAQVAAAYAAGVAALPVDGALERHLLAALAAA